MSRKGPRFLDGDSSRVWCEGATEAVGRVQGVEGGRATSTRVDCGGVLSAESRLVDPLRPEVRHACALPRSRRQVIPLLWLVAIVVLSVWLGVPAWALLQRTKNGAMYWPATTKTTKREVKVEDSVFRETVARYEVQETVPGQVPVSLGVSSYAAMVFAALCPVAGLIAVSLALTTVVVVLDANSREQFVGALFGVPLAVFAAIFAFASFHGWNGSIALLERRAKAARMPIRKSIVGYALASTVGLLVLLFSAIWGDPLRGADAILPTLPLVAMLVVCAQRWIFDKSVEAIRGAQADVAPATNANTPGVSVGWTSPANSVRVELVADAHAADSSDSSTRTNSDGVDAELPLERSSRSR